MYLLQIIALAIYAIVMVSAMRQFKKTILIWTPISMLFSPQVCVTYTSPITALTVATNVSLVFYYFVRVRNNFSLHGLRAGSFFFNFAINAMLISYILSTILSSIPLGYSLNNWIKTFFDQYGMVILFYRSMNSYDDIKLFVKASLLAILVAVGDGLIEFITKINPIGDFYYFNSRCDEITLGRGWHTPYRLLGEYNERFGLIRCYSVFPLHLIFGYACCLWMFVILLCQNSKISLYRRNDNYLKTVMFFLCMIGCVISNSKGPLICMLFILFTRYSIFKLFNLRLVLPIVIAVFVIYQYFPEYLNNIWTLLDSDVDAEAGGSTVDLREEQFRIAKQIFEMNPLTGMGINSGNYFKSQSFLYEGLLGLESVWLKILPDQGIIGVIAYLLMYLIIYNYGKKIVPRRMLLFYLVAILVYDTTNGHSIDRILWWMAPLLTSFRFYELKLKGKIHE